MVVLTFEPDGRSLADATSAILDQVGVPVPSAAMRALLTDIRGGEVPTERLSRLIAYERESFVRSRQAPRLCYAINPSGAAVRPRILARGSWRLARRVLTEDAYAPWQARLAYALSDYARAADGGAPKTAETALEAAARALGRPISGFLPGSSEQWTDLMEQLSPLAQGPGQEVLTTQQMNTEKHLQSDPAITPLDLYFGAPPEPEAISMIERTPDAGAAASEVVSPGMARAAGFWSYVHSDNSNDGGRIVRLAHLLKAEFEIITGEPLELFLDRDEIEWGEQWRQRIGEALQRTTFFIPVITPSYFRSEECRRELLTFAGEARSLGLDELLLPIYHVTVPELERSEQPTDEAMSLIADTQREDLREIRLLDPGDSAHLQAIHRLAQRLADITERTERRPDARIVIGPATREDEGGEVEAREGDEEAGFLELLAKGEEALPKWNETVVAIGQELETVGRITTEATPEIAAAPTFAQKLALANRLGNQLEEPAGRLVVLGQEYASHLVAVDPAILTLLRLAEETQEIRRSDEAQALFGSLRTMIDSSLEAIRGTMELVTSLRENAGVSRELRRPLEAIDGALRNVVDGQEIIKAWDARLRTIEDLSKESKSAES